MKLVYTLSEEDYLQHLLYKASKSETVKRKRLKSWLMVTACFFVLALLFYTSNNKFFSYYFIAGGIVTLFFYPLYLKSGYKKYYRKHILSTYKNYFNEASTVVFNEHTIETFDSTGELKINLSQIEKIAETGNYIYLVLKTSGSLIIPKLKIPNLVEVKSTLQELAVRLNIPYETEPGWKWK